MDIDRYHTRITLRELWAKVHERRPRGRLVRVMTDEEGEYMAQRIGESCRELNDRIKLAIESRHYGEAAKSFEDSALFTEIIAKMFMTGKYRQTLQEEARLMRDQAKYYRGLLN